MCGLIIEYLGWEAVFYITAGITLVWVVIWQVGRILIVAGQFLHPCDLQQGTGPV